MANMRQLTEAESNSEISILILGYKWKTSNTSYPEKEWRLYAEYQMQTKNWNASKQYTPKSKIAIEGGPLLPTWTK